MPPLSQLMQGGPGNVFGGFGQGLGSGIGAGVTKPIRRPLFNRLADKYVKGKQGEVEQSTLASLGLTQAPQAGAPQYEDFMMQMNQAMTPYQGRAENASKILTRLGNICWLSKRLKAREGKDQKIQTSPLFNKRLSPT